MGNHLRAWLGQGGAVLRSPALAVIEHGQVWIYWLACLSFALAFLSGRLLSSAVLLGCAIGLRQTGLILAGLTGLFAWHNLPISRVVAGAAWAAAVFVASIAFFTAGTPDVLHWIFIGEPAAATLQAARQGNPGTKIAAATFVQLALALGFAIAVSARRRMGKPDVLSLAGFAYVVIMSFNPYIHRYYYFPGVLVLGVGLATKIPAGPPWPMRRQ